MPANNHEQVQQVVQQLPPILREKAVDSEGRVLCEHCGERPGTIKWVGEGGFLALTHGMYQMWCERCVTIANLEHAEAQAAKIPDLKAKLAKLE